MNWGTTKLTNKQGGRRFMKLTAALILSLGLTACTGPLDQELVTNSTQEAYRASLDPLIAKMTPEEVKAFDWAVSDFDLPKLNAKYPRASQREIIRGEVRNVLDTYPGKIATLKADAARDAPVRADLKRIEAVAAQFFIDKNFFGLQPKIKASVINRSSRPVSQLKWNASLFLDGAATPVAQTVLTSDYRNNGGMKPGDAFTTTFNVGFVKGDERWTTLEIRNATKTRVQLELVIDSVQDFGDRHYIGVDPVMQINKLEAVIEAAKSFSDI